MSTGRECYYKGLFLIAAVYNVILGVVFTIFYRQAFSFLGILDSMPEYGAYVSMIGIFVFVVGVAFYLIYRGDLMRNQDLITTGALFKLAYCSVAFYYTLIQEVPHWIFVYLIGVCDLILFILMLECRLYLRKHSRPA